MPCYMKLPRIRRLINALKIKNEEKLKEILREEYTEKELHEMSEEELLALIKRIYDRNKKELTEEAILMYA